MNSQVPTRSRSCKLLPLLYPSTSDKLCRCLAERSASSTLRRLQTTRTGDVGTHSGDVISSGAALAATSPSSSKDKDASDVEGAGVAYDDIGHKSIVISPVRPTYRSNTLRPRTAPHPQPDQHQAGPDAATHCVPELLLIHGRLNTKLGLMLQQWRRAD